MLPKLSDSRAARNTEALLKLVSQHLQSRPELRKVEYQVSIENNVVKMYPMVKVFPSTHSRQSQNKEDIIYHVIRRHLNESDCIFVSGEYIHQFSINNKKRRWINKSLL